MIRLPTLDKITKLLDSPEGVPIKVVIVAKFEKWKIPQQGQNYIPSPFAFQMHS